MGLAGIQASALSSHPLAVPPFSRHLITVRFTAPVRFRAFQHGGVLRGLLSAALDTHELPEGLVPFAPESGRMDFARGDLYHIGITLVGAAGESRQELERGLSRLGAGPRSKRMPAVLAGNYALDSWQELPPPDLAAEEARLAALREVTLRFLSPLRVARPPLLVSPGARYLNETCFPVAHFFDRIVRRMAVLGAPGCRSPEVSADTGFHGPRLMWIDLPVQGANGVRRDANPRAASGRSADGPKHGGNDHRARDPRPKGYTLGGVVGSIRLSGVLGPLIPTLLLGRHLHVGENTHFGLGRFTIDELEAAHPEPFRPVRTALQRTLDPAALDEALLHLASKRRRGEPEADGVVTEARHRGVPELAESIAAGGFAPRPLRGWLRRKRKGGVRALAVPRLAERVVQRAAAAVLAPSIDALLEDCAFAYRKGISRAGAARALTRAFEEGFRYVLDADITSFFDAVDWDRLFVKLEALYPLEPLVPLIEAWVRAPVRFGERTIERERGLPQGMPLSPLLANLYLDELDEAMLGRNFRIARFADDFVVMCRDLESARAARDAAREALAKLSLTLNEEKTRVVSFEQGFDYLGYLFCRTVALEKGRSEPSPGNELKPEDVPRLSWVASVPFEELRSLQCGTGTSRGPARPEVVRLVLPGTTGPGRRHACYVSDPSAEIALRADALVVRRPAAEGESHPLESLSHLVLCGTVRATLPLLTRLARRGVPTFFCTRTGELQSVLGPFAPEWEVWSAQGRAAEDPATSLAFARAVVRAKLHNSARLVVRHRMTGHGEVAADLYRLERRAADAENVEALLGLEGQGAGLYFMALARSIADEWGFRGRRRQPPPDPVNSMLSFGYTILHRHLATALAAAGLNPRIGLFHRGRGAHQALASDMEEEFRVLVDAEVWALVRERTARPEAFERQPDGACYMGAAFRKTFIERMESRLDTAFTPADGAKTTYRRFMAAQGFALRAFIQGKLAAYEPLRLHT